MASTFKTLLNDDVVNTRTLLHEAIPITGTIVSGTYKTNAGAELNVKTYTHGIFESTYDYPYLSSSANHIFDVTYGYASDMSLAANTQNSKKLNIYNQFAQVLMGYDTTGSIRKFDSDGTLDDAANTMNSCFFLTFSRLLVKDEVKKGSFTLKMYPSSSVDTTAADHGAAPITQTALTLGDYGALNEYRTSPSGDYGLIFARTNDAPGHADADNSANNTKSIGLIFYQAGIVVLTSSFFQGASSFGYDGSSATANWGDGATPAASSETAALSNVAYTANANAARVFTPAAGANHPYATNDIVAISNDDGTGLVTTGVQAIDAARSGGLYKVTSTAATTFTLTYADGALSGSVVSGTNANTCDFLAGVMDAMGGAGNAQYALESGSIEDLSKGFRQRWIDCDFNNTIELNSTIYFARVNHNEFNYTSNPTYVSGSKLVVKNTIDDLPVSYITTIGLYSPDNELLAVAKLSEPLRKDPNTELTLRVRLDY
jgi:hypothetical protein